MAFQIQITPTALRMLKNISDRRVREKIVERIDGLAENPNEQGKPLLGELFGYRSTRVVGQRYRIIYKVEAERIIVTVVALGIRKQGDKRDVYELAQKLIRSGILGKK